MYHLCHLHGRMTHKLCPRSTSTHSYQHFFNIPPSPELFLLHIIIRASRRHRRLFSARRRLPLCYLIISCGASGQRERGGGGEKAEGCVSVPSRSSLLIVIPVRGGATVPGRLRHPRHRLSAGHGTVLAIWRLPWHSCHVCRSPRSPGNVHVIFYLVPCV